jgi:hypothetical protein
MTQTPTKTPTTVPFSEWLSAALGEQDAPTQAVLSKVTAIDQAQIPSTSTAGSSPAETMRG